MIRIAAIAVLLVGCADIGAIEDDDCSTSLSVNPSTPVVGEVLTVTAIISGNFGQPDIEWRVRFDQLDIVFERNGESEISFTPTQPGIYTIDMTPSSPGSLCPSRHEEITVTDGSTGDVEVRMHVTPPSDLGVPPLAKIVLLPRGTPAYALNVALDAGRTTTGTVGRAAYLRFIPDGQPDAVVEAYADTTGAFEAVVQAAPHHILVIPNDPAYPPQTFADIPGANESYALSTGVAITGTVRNPNGTPLAGAKVQVFMDDSYGIPVPSTIGTSAANGTFTLRSFAANGGNERVVVTPPIASGLPRLDAGSASFDFTNAVSVSYGASLAVRNVSGTDVVRGGALPNAKVTIVGTIPFAIAGTVVAGGSAVSNGYVRIPMTADASGALPSALVPAGDLFAVVEPVNAPGDAAVVPFDTSTAVPSTITAPPMVAIAPTFELNQVGLEGVRVELIPSGVLELAGVGPTVLYSNASGMVTGTVASGASYDARYSDPSRRAGPGVMQMTNATLLGSAKIFLEEPLTVTGTVTLQGSPNRVDGAAVQMLCSPELDVFGFSCEGSERDRPIGEDATDAQGSFTVVVPRPAVPI